MVISLTPQDLTVRELARLCRVHIDTAREWIRKGRVRAIRLPGGSFRIPESEVTRLRQFMDVGEVGSDGECGAYRIREAEIERLSKPVGEQDSPTRVEVSS